MHTGHVAVIPPDELSMGPAPLGPIDQAACFMFGVFGPEQPSFEERIAVDESVLGAKEAPDAQPVLSRVHNRPEVASGSNESAFMFGLDPEQLAHEEWMAWRRMARWHGHAHCPDHQDLME